METNQRNLGIDTIRGFLLVIMAFDHFIGLWNIFPNFRWIVLGMALISLSIPAIIRSRVTRSKAIAPRGLLASFAHRSIL